MRCDIPQGDELTRVAKIPRHDPAQIREAFGCGPPVQQLSGMPGRMLINVPLEAEVYMNGAQVQVVMDSLSRARACVATCIHIAEKAAHSFHAEAMGLEQLHNCVASYFSPSTGSGI